MFKGSLFPERYIFGVLGQLYCMIVEHIKAVVVIVIFIYNHKCTTVKPVLSGPPIKRTPFIKRTLAWVPKFSSNIYGITNL